MRTFPTLLLTLVVIWLLASLGGCEERAPQKHKITVAEALGGSVAEGFARADQVIDFHFPVDHGPHPDYRNEWWYVTGNLADQQGRRYGYQVTFFRIALLPPEQRRDTDSNWNPRHLWMAHAALTDAAGQRHYQQEKFSRGNPGMAGASAQPFRVWLDHWQLQSVDGDFPWQLDVAGDDFSLSLQLTALKPLVLQGNRGLSQKSQTPGNASYYYSYSRLATRGQLQLADGQHQVSGLSWFDREWSSSALDTDQQGWDWFSLQFEDGSELMYYQLRDRQGQTHASSQGSFVNASGAKEAISAAQIHLQPQRYWQDGRGSRYPVEWSLNYKNRQWIIRPLLDNQLMRTSVTYWEGAVEVVDRDSQRLLGRGYLEMTGY